MVFKKTRLADCCIIKPPKSEAKNTLSSQDNVSFVPMRNLGINKRFLLLNEDRKLSDVSGSYTYFAENDVLLAKITPCFENGKLGIATGLTNGIGFGSSEFIVFRAKEIVDPYYLYYYLLQSSFRESGQSVMTGAVGHKRVPKDFIENTEIPLPSIHEQKRIVAILDQAFAEIDKARANAEQNLKNARELFESYLQQVFSQRGEGWVESKLGDLFDIGSSKRIYEKDWTSSGVPFFGGKEIVKLAKYGTATSNAYISEEKYMDYASKYDMPQKGDILMTARGTIGVGYIVKEGDKFYYKDGNIISFRQKTPTSPQFVLYAFRSKQILDQIKGLTGTTVNHLPLKTAKEIILNIPKYHIQNRSVLQIKKMETNVQHLVRIYEGKILSLDELKKSILQKAFSGELTNNDSKGAAA